MNINLDNVNFINPYHHVFHTGEGMVHGPSHLNFWLKYFGIVAENTLILVRIPELYQWVKLHYPRFNVAYVKNVADVDYLFSKLNYVQNVYYSSNTGNTLHTLKFNEINHIFLGHGDSDKSASAHKYFRVYDEVWVAGQAHIDRFKNAGFDVDYMHFSVVGRPSLRNILKLSKVQWQARAQKSALYLPTWEGVYEESNYCSVALSEDIFKTLADLLPEYHLQTKFHPVTGSRDEKLKGYDEKLKNSLLELEAPVHLNAHGREISVEELIKNSNIFICDISAVVSECLASDAPIFIYIPKDKEIVIAKSEMEYSDYCYAFSNIEEFRDLIQEVIINDNDYLIENRKRAIEYIISPLETNNCTFEKKLFDVSYRHGLTPNYILPVRQ